MPFILPFAPKPDVDFTTVQVGDRVSRLMAGVIPMELNVTAVDDELIHCGGWTFDRRTGVEVDEYLSAPASQLVGFTPAGSVTEPS